MYDMLYDIYDVSLNAVWTRLDFVFAPHTCNYSKQVTISCYLRENKYN